MDDGGRREQRAKQRGAKRRIPLFNLVLKLFSLVIRLRASPVGFGRTVGSRSGRTWCLARAGRWNGSIRVI